MKILDFLMRRSSAPVARDRLQILLAHERSGTGNAELINQLREEVLAVIAKHVSVDPEKVQIKMDRGSPISTLELEIEISGLPSAKAA
ncbi:cell division topological specificity factor MinE [Lutibaculum baratangense]|uniref:Cell division topological specificity factor n=1 Tax=Lutibaculum baratangense AMV1 TaxID=631454 RepID=V4QXT9_9HYPH|nr:cell division topological specificity factor MinE [Lutibaculum baratangense]ESR24562.1 Cell division topological specificity factor MinE [Lutibaculum baratangense AMV1]